MVKETADGEVLYEDYYVAGDLEGSQLNVVVAHNLGWSRLTQARDGRLTGTPPKQTVTSEVPNYAADADIALTLPLAEGLCWRILGADFAPGSEVKGYQVCIERFGPYIMDQSVDLGRAWKIERAVNAPTIALGACRVWLKWRG